MTSFEALFGITKKEIKSNCLLMPLTPRFLLNELGIDKLNKAKIYSTANNNNLTLINTKVGAGFVGDTVLYLKDSPCQNLILFGTCGLVNMTDNLNIGSLVIPKKCYPLESFTDLLLEKPFPKQGFCPDQKLYQTFLQTHQRLKNKDQEVKTITAVDCATMASLKLEEQWQSRLMANNINIVDMECSAFFSSAAHVNLKAIALFCISDIIETQPFYHNLSQQQEHEFKTNYQQAAYLINHFLQQLKQGSV